MKILKKLKLAWSALTNYDEVASHNRIDNDVSNSGACKNVLKNKYYKILKSKYYGLQGAEWRYHKALITPDLSVTCQRDTKWVAIGSYIDDYSCYNYLMPYGAVEVSEEEYMEKTK